MYRVELERIYEYGDVYETIDTCDELEMQLSRLKRRRILNEEEWLATRNRVEAIRSQLADHVAEPASPSQGNGRS